jgi:hypothetical protein
MKNYLVFSFIILAFVSCKQEAKFTEVNINQRYTIQLPDYLQACTDLHENASLQYQNAELDIYAMVIEEKKSTMENYDLDYDLELYYNSIASQAFVDNIKNGKVSPAGRQEINGNKAIVSEITGNFDGNSSNCACAIVEGLSIITSRPELFLGKAIKSLITSAPPNKEHKRSKPKAIPPCGGAPNSKAFIKKPNCLVLLLCKA